MLKKKSNSETNTKNEKMRNWTTDEFTLTACMFYLMMNLILLNV